MKSKAEVRSEARARLAAISEKDRARHGAEIARRVWTVPEIAEARTLLLYASVAAEVPTDAIAEQAFHRGIEVVYPRCLVSTRAMTLHRVASVDRLVTGSYGIREPGDDCPDVAVGDVDVVMMPGLGWDRQGNRLGRGAGYYDRLLAREEFRAFTCGIFFAGQEFVHLPIDEWDVPLHAIATEREIYRPA